MRISKSRDDHLTAMVLFSTGALALTFLLAIVGLIRNIVFNYLGLGETLIGHLVLTGFSLIFLAFAVMLISIYRPSLIEKVI